MSDGVASEIGTIIVGETRTLTISYAGLLAEPIDSAAGEVLTGTPTFVQYKWNNTTGAWDSSTDLTVNSATVNTSPVLVSANQVRSGAAVLARVIGTGAVAGTRYRLVCTAVSNSSPAQTLLGIVGLTAVGAT